MTDSKFLKRSHFNIAHVVPFIGACLHLRFGRTRAHVLEGADTAAQSIGTIGQRARRILIFLAATLIGGVGGSLWCISNLEKDFIKRSSLQSARLYAKSLEEFRSLYTSEVVAKISLHPDFTVTHK